MAGKDMTVQDKMYSKLLQAMELDALATMPDADIASVVGVSASTIQRWRTYPAYRALLNEKCLIIFQGLVPKAIKAIQDILDSPTARPKVKLDAAKLILDKTMPDLQQVDERSLQAIKVTVSYE